MSLNSEHLLLDSLVLSMMVLGLWFLDRVESLESFLKQMMSLFLLTGGLLDFCILSAIYVNLFFILRNFKSGIFLQLKFWNLDPWHFEYLGRHVSVKTMNGVKNPFQKGNFGRTFFLLILLINRYLTDYTYDFSAEYLLT